MRIGITIGPICCKYFWDQHLVWTEKIMLSKSFLEVGMLLNKYGKVAKPTAVTKTNLLTTML